MSETKQMELLGDFQILFFFGIGLVFICSLWLWVLIWKKDLWARFVSMESVFYSYLRLPSRYIAWRQRFALGRAEIRFVATMLIVTSLSTAVDAVAYVYFKHGFEKNHQPNKFPQPTRGDAFGYQEIAGFFVLRSLRGSILVLRPENL